MKAMLNVKDVKELLRVADSTAYTIIRQLNKELQAQGYKTVSGKVEKNYFYKNYFNNDEQGEKEPEQVTIIDKSELQTTYDDIVAELKGIYERKNHDYGDSFKKTYEKLGLISAVTRINDKNNRLVNLMNNKKQVNESIEDTLKDMANYCILTLIELKNEVVKHG